MGLNRDTRTEIIAELIYQKMRTMSDEECRSWTQAAMWDVFSNTLSTPDEALLRWASAFPEIKEQFPDIFASFDYEN